MSRRGGVVVYIGNLPLDIKESEIEKLFAKYGKLRRLDIKRPPRPPAFCFIEYDHIRQAEQAIKGRDRYDFDGERLRVEIAQGGRGGSSIGGGYGGGRDYGGPSFRRGPKGTGYRIIVEGLPRSASWQDLKDHVRPIVNPAFTDVVRDRRAREGVVGIVEFHTYDDMRYAIRKLDSSRFENVFDRGYTLKVREEGDNASRSRSASSRSRSRSPRRSYSRSYTRSDSYTKSRSRSRTVSSRSRSRSRSPTYSKSRSRSRTRSRSLSRSKSPGARSDRSMSKDRSKSRSPSSRSRSRSPSRSPSADEKNGKLDTENGVENEKSLSKSPSN